MNEITQITPQIKDKKRCNIYIDGRFCCGILLETVIKNRLKVGTIITQEELSRLQLESEKNTALDKALAHISATQKTEKQVRDFLSKKGYLSAVIEYVVKKMKEYRFLNDEEYAENYVASASKRKGSRLIEWELRGKGITDAEISSALETLEEGQELQTAKTILDKYMKNKNCDAVTLQKAFRYLMGKGFDYDTAKSAISAYGNCDETEDF